MRSLPPLSFAGSAIRGGFESNAQARAGGGGESLQGSSGRPSATSFQARDDGLRGLHFASDLFLGEASAGAGLDQRGCEVEFLFQGFVFFTILGVVQPALVKTTGSERRSQMSSATGCE